MLHLKVNSLSIVKECLPKINTCNRGRQSAFRMAETQRCSPIWGICRIKPRRTAMETIDICLWRDTEKCIKAAILQVPIPCSRWQRRLLAVTLHGTLITGHTHTQQQCQLVPGKSRNYHLVVWNHCNAILCFEWNREWYLMDAIIIRRKLSCKSSVVSHRYMHLRIVSYLGWGYITLTLIEPFYYYVIQDLLIIPYYLAIYLHLEMSWKWMHGATPTFIDRAEYMLAVAVVLITFAPAKHATECLQ